MAAVSPPNSDGDILWGSVLLSADAFVWGPLDSNVFDVRFGLRSRGGVYRGSFMRGALQSPPPRYVSATTLERDSALIDFCSIACHPKDLDLIWMNLNSDSDGDATPGPFKQGLKDEM